MGDVVELQRAHALFVRNAATGALAAGGPTSQGDNKGDPFAKAVWRVLQVVLATGPLLCARGARGGMVWMEEEDQWRVLEGWMGDFARARGSLFKV